MFCTNCGKPLREGARFCDNCGKAVGEEAIREADAQAVMQTVGIRRENKQGFWRFGLAACCFMAVLLGVGAVVFGWRQIGGSEDSWEEDTDSETENEKEFEAESEKESDRGNDLGEERDGEWVLTKWAVYEEYGDGDTDILSLWEFEYDESGNKRKAVRYDWEGDIQEEYEYDEEGNLRKKTEIYKDGLGAPALEGVADPSDTEWEPQEKVYQYVYVYDAEGTLVRDAEYGKNGNLIEESENKVAYTYDAQGKMIKEEFYGIGDAVLDWIEYEYDADGRLLKKYEYDIEHDGATYWTDYSYTDGGRTEISRFGDSGSEHSKCSYDASENITESVRYDADGNILWGRRYEYDAFGNLGKVAYDQDDLHGEVEFGLMEALGKKVYVIDEVGNNFFSEGYERIYFDTYEAINAYGIFGIPTKETVEGEYDNWTEMQYEHDEEGKLTGAEITELSSDNNSYYLRLGGIFEFRYDDNGNLMEVDYCDAKGNRILWQEYEYKKME